MKILHVVENLNRGGLERVVVELIRAQRSLGHDCRVVCIFEDGLLAAELRSLGVRVDACHKRTGVDLRALIGVRRAFREHRTDVLHTHNPLAHYNAICATLGLRRRRVVNTRHGMGAIRGGTRRERLYRLTMHATDVAVCVCSAARDEFVRRGVIPTAKALVVANGIRTDGFEARSSAARQALARELGYAPDTRLIGTVGRLNWAKNHAMLLDAFVGLAATEPNLALVLIGGGALESDLRARAAALGIDSRISFLGDRDDVPRLLTGLDLFVLSSLTEGYSIALLEAAAAALPIIATDVGGNGEIAAHGVRGLLVPPSAPEQFAAAIRSLLADDHLREQLGRAARAWVLAEGSFRTMAERYEAIYSSRS
jgi:glycosyltransferase involved in cell wall biosynthesis